MEGGLKDDNDRRRLQEALKLVAGEGKEEET